MMDADNPIADKPKASRWRGKPILFVAILIVMLSVTAPVLFVRFIAQPVRVQGKAMLPTLKDGDRIFVSKHFGKLQRNDIIVFRFPLDPSKSFIKRIVGLPGETIRMDKEGQLFINDTPVSEPYLLPTRNLYPHPIAEQRIAADHYFVMGDNRDASNDSRSWGTVSQSLIYGRYLFRCWSIEDESEEIFQR